MVVVSTTGNAARFPGKGGYGGCGAWVPVWVTPGLCPSRKIRAFHLASRSQPGIAAAGFALQHCQRSRIFHWAAETPFPAGGPRSAASPETLSACVYKSTLPRSPGERWLAPRCWGLTEGFGGFAFPSCPGRWRQVGARKPCCWQGRRGTGTGKKPFMKLLCHDISPGCLLDTLDLQVWLQTGLTPSGVGDELERLLALSRCIKKILPALPFLSPTLSSPSPPLPPLRPPRAGRGQAEAPSPAGDPAAAFRRSRAAGKGGYGQAGGQVGQAAAANSSPPRWGFVRVCVCPPPQGAGARGGCGWDGLGGVLSPVLWVVARQKAAVGSTEGW